MRLTVMPCPRAGGPSRPLLQARSPAHRRHQSHQRNRDHSDSGIRSRHQCDGAATARIVRFAPGEKNLKNATPIQLQDLQVGDRILVAGRASDDNLSLARLEDCGDEALRPGSASPAGSAGLAEAWRGRPGQRRGSRGRNCDDLRHQLRGKKNIVIHASKATVIRRYAPDSVKFDDAKPEHAAGSSSRRSGARARRPQRRWQRTYRRRNCFRIVPQCCRHRQLRRCKFVDAQRSGFVVEKNSARQSDSGFATSSFAP